MAGASVETTLELWASSLRDVKARRHPLFSQERVATSAGKFLDGLLGNDPERRGGCARKRRAIAVRGVIVEALAGSGVADTTLQMIDATIVRAHHCAAGGRGEASATRSVVRVADSQVR